MMIIVVYLLICSIAWCLPLMAWLQNYKQALKWSMPVSWSIQILVGYVFYSATLISWYLPIYIAIVVLVNIAAVLVWRKRLPVLPSLPKFNVWYVVFATIAVSVTVYTRLYDPLHTLAPGNNDTANHLGFLYDLYQLGFLSNPYYAPGYHLIFGILTQWIDQVTIYRWVGPVTSIFLVVGIYLFVRDYIQHALVRWVYVIGSSCFLLHQWMLQTMSLFSSALTFLYIIAFLTLLSDTTYTWKRRIGLYLLCGLALSVSVPYFFIQFIFVVFALLIIALAVKSFLTWKFYAAVLLVTVGFIGVGIAHVYLQTRLLQRGGGFPEVPIITKNDNNKITLTSNFDGSVSEVINDPNSTQEPTPATTQTLTARIIAFFDQFQTLSWYSGIRPFIVSGIDIIFLKQIRPANTLLSVGAYLWALIAAVMLTIGVRRRSISWVVVAMASLLYGFAIQTGSLELSFYRGRSGWYLLWLALFGGVLFMDHYYRSWWKWPLLVGGLLLAVLNVVRPPTFYRAYDTNTFDASWTYISKAAEPRPVIITRQPLLRLLYPKAVILPYDVSALTLSNTETNRFLILEKEFFAIDPVLSQQGLSGDNNYAVFYAQQESFKAMLDQTNAAIFNSPEFANYELVWENNAVAIYQFHLPK